MKLTVITSKHSSYSNIAKSLLIRLSREMPLEYEIVEVDGKEKPIIVKDRELPCFLINDKIIMSGKPSYSELKKILSKKRGVFGLFKN